jgi:hypothetical protein
MDTKRTHQSVTRFYRKKPIVVRAYRTHEAFDIETLEGTMHADIGDWIITGIRGERYPCKPDIFEATYELAPDHVEDKIAAIREQCVGPNRGRP